MRNAVTISKTTLAIFLVVSFLFSPLLASAQGTATPPVASSKGLFHSFENTGDGSTIVDTAYSDSAGTTQAYTQNFTYWWYAPKSEMKGVMGLFAGELMYSIDGITAPGKEYYVGVGDKSLMINGLFKLDRASKNFNLAKDSDILSDFAGTGDASKRTHLLELVDALFNVNNMSVGSVADTTKKITNCKLAFDPATAYSGSQFYSKLSAADKARADTGQDARVYMWFKPKGSSYYSMAPATTTVQKDGTYSFPDNLKEGDYTIGIRWALRGTKQADNSFQGIQYDELSEGNNPISDLIYEAKRTDMPTAGLAAGGLAILGAVSGGTLLPSASVLAAIALNKGKKDVVYDVYGSNGTSFTVTADASSNVICPNLSIAFITTTVDSKRSSDDTCGAINSTLIVQWSLCELLLGARYLAKWAYDGAVNIFTSMTNISGVNIDTSGASPLTLTDTSSSAGGGSPGVGTTPASTPAATAPVAPSQNSSKPSGNPGQTGSSTPTQQLITDAKSECAIRYWAAKNNATNATAWITWGTGMCLANFENTGFSIAIQPYPITNYSDNSCHISTKVVILDNGCNSMNVLTSP